MPRKRYPIKKKLTRRNQPVSAREMKPLRGYQSYPACGVTLIISSKCDQEQQTGREATRGDSHLTKRTMQEGKHHQNPLTLRWFRFLKHMFIMENSIQSPVPKMPKFNVRSCLKTRTIIGGDDKRTTSIHFIDKNNLNF